MHSSGFTYRLQRGSRAVSQCLNYLRHLDEQGADLRTHYRTERNTDIDFRRARGSIVIGHPGRAISERSLALALDAKIRDRATYMIRRATAQADGGEMEKAAHFIKEAVPLIHQAPSERNIQRIKRARQKVAFSGSDPRGKELDEQLAGLVA